MYLVSRVLRKEHAVAAAKRTEDFAHVVQGFAEGVRRANRQLLEQVVGPEFCLQGVVIGIAGVCALTHHTLVAIDTTSSNWVKGLRRRTRSKAGWNQIREVRLQVSNKRIFILR